MPRKSIILLIIVSTLGSCIVKKKTTYSKTRTVTVTSDESPPPTTSSKKERKKKVNKKADNVVAHAMTFTGTRYKFGGTTKKGMDCSGLVYMALLENEIPFPRVSYNMANEGKRVRLNEVEKGDLLFFKTTKSGKRINHVGLVVDVEGDNIRFIHATSSRGVIVSSLREGFWNHSFVKATRIL